MTKNLEEIQGLARHLNVIGDVGLVDQSKLNAADFNAVLDAAAILSAIAKAMEARQGPDPQGLDGNRDSAGRQASPHPHSE